MVFKVGQKVTPKRPDTDWVVASNVCKPNAVPVFETVYTVAKIVDDTSLVGFILLGREMTMLQLVELTPVCSCGAINVAFDADEFKPVKTVEAGMDMLNGLLVPTADDVAKEAIRFGKELREDKRQREKERVR